MKTSVSGSATTTYAYDIENRLTSVTTSSSTTTFGYSAEGRRLKRVSGGTTTYFGNDPVSPSRMDDTIEDYTSTGTKTATYLHGIGGDELLGYKTTAWYEYHGDALDSVTRTTDSAGATASTYRYDTFGAIRGQSGSGNTYGFTSRENEAALGLYYNRARYYNPTTGRFGSKDPAGMAGGTNAYAYAGNNPVNFIDPTGMLAAYQWRQCAQVLWWSVCETHVRIVLTEWETQGILIALAGGAAFATILWGYCSLPVVTAPICTVGWGIVTGAILQAAAIIWFIDWLGHFNGIYIEAILESRAGWIWHN